MLRVGVGPRKQLLLQRCRHASVVQCLDQAQPQDVGARLEAAKLGGQVPRQSGPRRRLLLFSTAAA
jgi:hypothetical protein